MKLGATAIVLRMIEGIYISDIPLLQDPVKAFRAISRDITFGEAVLLRNGKMSAIDIQWRYYDLADAYVSQFGCSVEENALMNAWEQALTDMEQDPMKLRDRADWVLKKHLLNTYLSQSGVSWETLSRNKSIQDGLQARDLLYHDISQNGLFNRVCYPDTFITEAEIQNAQNNPPDYTRARVRGEAIKHAQELTVDSWMDISIKGKKISLADPLEFNPPQFSLNKRFDKQQWEKHLIHKDPHIRIRVVKQLMWQKSAAARAMLIDRLKNDDNEQVRCAAVEALSHRTGKVVMDTLVACLRILAS